MKSIAQMLFCILLAGVIAGGCSKPAAAPKVAMANPPEFGSKSELKDWKGFIAGRWGLKSHLDTELARSLGLGSIADQQESDAKTEKITDVLTFKEDGTFRYTGHTFGHKIEGEWKDSGEVVALAYTKIDGKPYQEKLAELQKSAEGGGQAALYENEFADWLNKDLQQLTQLKLSKDRKELIFLGATMTGEIGEVGQKLVRLEAAPKD